MQQLFAGFPMPIPDAGGGGAKTYTTTLPVVGADTDFSVPGMTKLYSVNMFYGSPCNIFSMNGSNWKMNNNAAVTFPFNFAYPNAERINSINKAVINYYATNPVFLMVVGE